MRHNRVLREIPLSHARPFVLVILLLIILSPVSNARAAISLDYWDGTINTWGQGSTSFDPEAQVVPYADAIRDLRRDALQLPFESALLFVQENGDYVLKGKETALAGGCTPMMDKSAESKLAALPAGTGVRIVHSHPLSTIADPTLRGSTNFYQQDAVDFCAGKRIAPAAQPSDTDLVTLIDYSLKYPDLQVEGQVVDPAGTWTYRFDKNSRMADLVRAVIKNQTTAAVPADILRVLEEFHSGARPTERLQSLRDHHIDSVIAEAKKLGFDMTFTPSAYANGGAPVPDCVYNKSVPVFRPNGSSTEPCVPKAASIMGEIASGSLPAGEKPIISVLDTQTQTEGGDFNILDHVLLTDANDGCNIANPAGACIVPTSKVIVSGDTITSATPPGTYTIFLNYTNAAGNVADQKTVTVNILPKASNTSSQTSATNGTTQTNTTFSGNQTSNSPYSSPGAANGGDSGALVPCGTHVEAKQVGNQMCTVGECTVCHLQIMGMRIINFLIAAGVLVAALLFVNAGVLYVLSPANPGNIARAHKVFMGALTGLVLLLAAYLVIDVIMRGLAGQNQKWGPWQNLLCDSAASRNCVDMPGQLNLEGSSFYPHAAGPGFKPSDFDANGKLTDAAFGRAANALSSTCRAGSVSCADLIIQKADELGIPRDFALALATAESSGLTGEVSNKGAVGVMQVLPGTARQFCGAECSGMSDAQMTEWLKNPVNSIDVGMKYLDSVYDSKIVNQSGDPNMRLALTTMGYNAGLSMTESASGKIGPFAASNDCPGYYAAQCSKNPGGFDKTQNYCKRILPGNSYCSI